jgi:acetyl-CoA acetyltransferase
VSGLRLKFLARFVAWLRAGYPAEAPGQGYIPLLGLLRRSLSDLDIAQVADKLIDEAGKTLFPITPDGIEQMIRRTVLQNALPDDVARVAALLASRGWSLAAEPFKNE